MCETAYARDLPGAPASASSARRLVSVALRAWGLDQVRETAGLVVTELVANAVEHAGAGDIRVTVLRLDRRSLRVAVVDRSARAPLPQHPGPDDVSGRGLVIVDALTAGRWGTEPLPGGKRVWADLAIDGEPRDD